MTDELQRSKKFMPDRDLVLVGANTACFDSVKTSSLHEDAKIVSQRHCKVESADLVNGVVLHHLQTRGTVDPFWISLNSNVFKPTEFRSNSRDINKDEAYDEGISLNFVHQFISRFGSHATGLDLSEVNFSAADGAWRHADQQTFRELIELILHQVNEID